MVLLEEYRPMLFFGILSFMFLIASMILGIPVILEYFRTGLVPRFPSLIVSGIFLVITLLLWVCGLILQVIVKKNKQQYELMMNLLTKAKK